MSVEPDYGADMKLPEGKTCAACAHIKRCTAFGFTDPTLSSCDFWPNKYRPANSVEDGPAKE